VGVRVLLVEDEARLARIVSDGLTDEGIDVEHESDGDAGLWRAIEGSYDVIILDIMLPKKNGFQICHELREAQVWTPVLMLTAKDGEYDEAEALDTGADDFLRKPFSFVVLLARLRALARRGAPERPAVLQPAVTPFGAKTSLTACGASMTSLHLTWSRCTSATCARRSMRRLRRP